MTLKGKNHFSREQALLSRKRSLEGGPGQSQEERILERRRLTKKRRPGHRENMVAHKQFWSEFSSHHLPPPWATGSAPRAMSVIKPRIGIFLSLKHLPPAQETRCSSFRFTAYTRHSLEKNCTTIIGRFSTALLTPVEYLKPLQKNNREEA